MKPKNTARLEGHNGNPKPPKSGAVAIRIARGAKSKAGR
jgi:hypothetical protein